jgi:hypothetical protein
MAVAQNLTVRPDSKGRITLGNLAKGVSSFRIHLEADGRIVLEPFAEIPARELWLYKNPEALAMVERGLADSAAGRTSYLGNFAQYATDDISED